MSTAVIIILLAAILITLLGAWGKIPGILAFVGGIIVYVVIFGFVAAHVSETAGYIWLALPWALLLVYGFYGVHRGHFDWWGNPKEPDHASKSSKYQSIGEHNRREIERARASKRPR